jgi:hypothetical protein
MAGAITAGALGNMERELELITYIEAINDGDSVVMEEFDAETPLTGKDVKPLLNLAISLAIELGEADVYKVHKELTEFYDASCKTFFAS